MIVLTVVKPVTEPFSIWLARETHFSLHWPISSLPAQTCPPPHCLDRPNCRSLTELTRAWRTLQSWSVSISVQSSTHNHDPFQSWSVNVSAIIVMTLTFQSWSDNTSVFWLSLSSLDQSTFQSVVLSLIFLSWSVNISVCSTTSQFPVLISQHFSL